MKVESGDHISSHLLEGKIIDPWVVRYSNIENQNELFGQANTSAILTIPETHQLSEGKRPS